MRQKKKQKVIKTISVLADFWEGIPKEVKILLAVAIFLYAGTTILKVVVLAWNMFGVNAMNAINGCWTGTVSACVPMQHGIFIFGINFADYWTITIIMILLPIAMFAIKWYSFVFSAANQS